MTLPRDIYELQELDTALDTQRLSLKQVEARLGDEREVLEAAARLEAARQRRIALDRDMRYREGELEEVARKLSTVEEKLYSGRVTNFKELEDLQKEADSLRHRRQQEEEQVLGLMEEAEATGKETVTAQQALGVVRQRWGADQQHLAQQRDELLLTIAELEGRLQGVVKRIEPAPLRLYDDLRRSRQQAVARVEQGRCQGCRVSMSMHEVQKARGSVIQCSSCGRILYSP
ncbi:MAG: hypothetical protein AAB270_09720 [Chloroflexota bacterium]